MRIPPDPAKLPKLEQELGDARVVWARDGTEEAAIRLLLRSEQGKVLLAHLDRVFRGGIVAKSEAHGVDVHGTMINVGAYSVVEYLTGLTEDREE